MAENFLSCQPDEYYQRFLDHEIRPDGRKLNEYRQIRFGIDSVTTADGSAVLKIGKTTAVCGVRAELANPPDETPNEGYLLIRVEIPSITSGIGKPGQNSEEATSLTQMVQEMVTNSKMLDLASLNISPGALSWVLNCDVIVCNNDGNALDACLLALVGALLNTKLPQVSIEEDSPVPIVNSTVMSGLVIRDVPVSVSSAIFRENYVILDPNSEEEVLSSGHCIVCVMEKGDMCYMSSVGAGFGGEKKENMFDMLTGHAHRIRKELLDSCKGVKMES